MTYNYEYPRPCVTLDSAILRTPELKFPEILLIKRGREPFKDLWALPGGFLEMEEAPMVGAARELHEETGLLDMPLKPLFTCGEPGRDPRARTFTMVFACLIRDSDEAPIGADDAAKAEWSSLKKLPEMAFDHERIIRQISNHLVWQAKTAIIGQDVFHKVASKKDIFRLHENILPEAMLSFSEFFLKAEKNEFLSCKEGLCQYLPTSGAGPDWNPMVW